VTCYRGEIEIDFQELPGLQGIRPDRSKVRESPGGEGIDPTEEPSGNSEALQFVAITPSESQSRAATEYDYIFAVEQRMKLFDMLDIDHGRTADSQEMIGGELGFERGHRFAQQVNLVPNVKLHVIVGRLDPVNLRKL